MNLSKSEKYLKIEKEFLRIHGDIKDKYIKTLELLEENPRHPSLRLHKIKSKNNPNIYSVSIDMQYRIAIDFIIDREDIILIRVGDHSIYKSL